jgi:predicted DNA-binding protein
MNGNMEPTVVRMTPAMREALQSLAELNDRTMSAEIRRAIREHLAKVEVDA